MYVDYNHMNMFHGIGMLFWFVLFIIIVLLAISFFKKKDCSLKKDSPMDILKSRYAKGEITKEEFDQIKNDII